MSTAELVETEEGYEVFVNAQTLRFLDLSADEFRERAATGSLPDHPSVAHLLLLAGVESPETC